MSLQKKLYKILTSNYNVKIKDNLVNLVDLVEKVIDTIR